MRPSTVLVPLLAVCCAAVPVALGPGGDPALVTRWGLLSSGLAAALSGGWVLFWWAVRRRARRDTAAAWRCFFGLAVLTWGLGQLLLSATALRGPLEYPSWGDLVSGLAAPLSLVALLSVPRRPRSSWPGLRLGLDTVLLGLAAALLVRTTGIIGAGDVPAADDVSTLLFVSSDTGLFALVLLAAIRDVRARLTPALCGVGCYVVADLWFVHAAADGVRDLPWQAATLWCLGWPLMALGIVRYRPRRPEGEDSPAQDRREALAAQVAHLAAVCFAVAASIRTGAMQDPASRALLLICAGLLVAREIVGAVVRVQLTARLRAQAYRDPLTGLANRRALTARIDRLLADPEEVRGGWVVLTLDLDGFTEVNDVFGQPAGDRLLVAVGAVLRDAVPERALVARIGGDEFTVLAPGDLAAGEQLAELFRSGLHAVFDEHAAGLGTSAGVGVGRLVGPGAGPAPEGPAGGAGSRRRLEALLESAAALRAAKSAGRGRIAVYGGEIAAARERRMLLERRLRLAVDQGSVVTVGQPLVRLDGEGGVDPGRVVGFEALARWTDEELGFVPPDEFIEVAEQTGLVVALGEHLLDVTLRDAVAAGVFAAGLYVAVNASPVELRAPGFAAAVERCLTRHGVPPQRLLVEVTEAILVTDGDPAVRTLQQLAALGARVAIDDFGTGYSAIGYLRRLPVQVLKIDRTLTAALPAEEKTVAIVEGVIRIAHRIGIDVVMEGIEDDQVADACRALGADTGQGWHFGRPGPWAAVPALLAADLSDLPRQVRRPDGSRTRVELDSP